MRILLAGLCLLLLRQDPFGILSDPARRAREEDRRAALEAFRSKAAGSAVHFAAARFLEKSDRQWRLVYDRLKTPKGDFAGVLEGGTLVTFSGQRLPASSGTVEKEVRDPAAAEVDAFLARFWSAAPSTEEQHRQALEAVLQAIGRAEPSEASLSTVRRMASAMRSMCSSVRRRWMGSRSVW